MQFENKRMDYTIDTCAQYGDKCFKINLYTFDYETGSIHLRINVNWYSGSKM